MKTLVILAAGNGSRFGGLKQFTFFGPQRKTLMEYNIEHAISAGFEHLIFVIQADHQKQLTESVINALPKAISYQVVIQSNRDLPRLCNDLNLSDKPLGTAHAIWCCRQYITSNFTVINGDDYYGKQAFHLAQQAVSTNNEIHYLVAFELQNTLSLNGGVNRGLCKINEQRMLTHIEEVKNIRQIGTKITGEDSKKNTMTLAGDRLVSMNFWVFHPDILKQIAQLLATSFSQNTTERTECYLPDAAMAEITGNNRQVSLLTSHDDWFGVTYAQDRDFVNEQFSKLADLPH